MIPHVSLIIPVYNVEKYLEKCLDSAVNQTLKKIEIIIVNDGSTDGSLTIIESYAKNDPRIQVITQKNGGLSAARNTGIKAASGEYIAFLDSDDYVKKELIEETYNKATKEKVDIVVYGYDKIKEDGTLVSKPDFGNNIFEHNEALNEILSLSISPMACNKMYRRKLFIEHNIYYPLQKLHEDVGTTYKLFWKAKKIVSTSKSYYYWIIRDGSITSKITYKHVNDIFDLFHEKKIFLKRINKFEQFQESYEIGFIKMINLLFERVLTNELESKSLFPYLVQKVNDLEVDIVNKENVFYKKMKNFVLDFNPTLDRFDQLNAKYTKAVSRLEKQDNMIKKMDEVIAIKNAFMQKQEVMILKRDEAILKKDAYIIKLTKMLENRDKKVALIENQIKTFENNAFNKLIPFNKKICRNLKEELRK